MQLRDHQEVNSRLLGARGQHLGALVSRECVSRLATLPGWTQIECVQGN